MSTVDADITTTAHSVHLVPHYPNKEPIVFSGNDAEIAGIMHELKLFLVRVDKHQPLLSDRAVLVSNGKTAVDSVHAIPFLMGNLADAHDFDDPPPLSPARFTAANAVLTGGGAAAVALPGAPLPGSDIVVSKFAVKHDDSKLLQIFETVFGAYAEDEILQAAGSGLAFIPLIIARGAAASGRAKALVQTKFSTFVAAGISGELTSDSNKLFFTQYDRLKRVLPVASRPDPAAESEMVSTMAHVRRASLRSLSFSTHCIFFSGS